MQEYDRLNKLLCDTLSRPILTPGDCDRSISTCE